MKKNNECKQTIIKTTYKSYSREDHLCCTNGHFSLNLTPNSVLAIDELLAIDENSTILWVGCGNAPELISIAQIYPRNLFYGIDINQDAIEVATIKKESFGLTNLKLECKDVFDIDSTFTHVYSTALAGPKMYNKLFTIATKKCVVLSEMVTEKYKNHIFWFQRVSLSGSREKRILSAITLE